MPAMTTTPATTATPKTTSTPTTIKGKKKKSRQVAGEREGKVTAGVAG